MKEKYEISNSVTEKEIQPIDEQIEPASVGGELARVFLEELHTDDLPEPRQSDKNRWIKELCSEVPQRGGKIGFQEKEGQDVSKWAFSPAIAADPSEEECKRLFCMVHGEFVPSGCTASEHAYPYAKMRENQQRVLNYLNLPENRDIADIFLQCKDIEDYIRRDDADGRVKGSIYFYKRCYNIMDNLFLMCQGCNGSKGDKEPLNWFVAQEIYFGEPFVEHVNGIGGLQEGILLPRIYRENEQYLRVQFSEETSVMLPSTESNAKGLGVVIRDWLFKHYGAIFKEHREFYINNFNPLKNHLEYLGSLLVSGNEDSAKQAAREQVKLRKDMKTLAIVQRHILGESKNYLYQKQVAPILGGHSSSSENSQVDEFENTDAIESYVSGKLARHSTHKLRSVIRAIYGEEFASSVYTLIKTLRATQPKLPGDSWVNIFTYFCEYMADFNEAVKSPCEMQVEIKTKISELYENERRALKVVSIEELEREREEKQAVKEELEHERIKKQAVEDENRAQAEKIAELERRLEQKKDDSPHGEQSPPGSPLKSPTFFSSQDESKKNSPEDRKRKRESNADSFGQEIITPTSKVMKK